MDDEDRTSARAIANGIQAWKKLTHRKVPATKEPITQTSDSRWAPPADNNAKHEVEENEHDKVEGKDNVHSPVASTIPSTNLREKQLCPFAATSSSPPANHPNIQLPEPSAQRPDSLPTPPEPGKDQRKELTPPPVNAAPSSSPPPSATGSTSKCPIRFLDHYSPEEVAEYFKNHRHEIPRSHEICVRRYQRNAESIRQLDSKYGNLVSMIQGLGMKHQSLLPATEEQEQDDHISQKKIEKWANDVGGVPSGEALAGTGPKAEGDAQADMVEKGEEDKREGRSEKPLKEIRVGESPSRPWGISMPISADMHPTAINASLGGQGGEDKKGGRKEEDVSFMAPLLPDLQPAHTSQAPSGNSKGIVFTGPVFVGYTTEQAVEVMQRVGKDAEK